MRKPKKTREPDIARLVLRSLERNLTYMEVNGRINDWGGKALASWIEPGVTRTVKNLLKCKP